MQRLAGYSTLTIHLLDFKAPSLDVPRMHPCQATGTGPHAVACGATPASLWRRSCANGHERDCWLCPAHARLLATSLGQCADCAGRGAAGVRAVIAPVELLLAGYRA